ncbi:TetR/AcrR family transcriptional regulator [Nonomuraea sp. NPDC050153]|uniref:TetR/AcrR family transcriptional regulator n=1 Tax=Nonomuraea sp. NPDC050153 TaxID=3364359 RepID=UPI00379800A1
MATETERHLRADAARNAERIVRAAHAAFTDDGPDVSLEEIARRAGVGIRTLYRHFPRRGDLIQAVLDQRVTEDLMPAIQRALDDDNPLHGLTTLIETALAMVAREMNTLTAAKSTDSLTPDLSTAYFEAMTQLMHRAQQARLLRADLVPDDLTRIMAMLTGVLWSMDPKTEGWRRYLGFVLDGLSPATATVQPPAVPVVRNPRAGSLFD